MRRVKRVRASRLPGDYQELVAAFPLRVLADEIDYDNAQEMIDALIALPRRTRGQTDYLMALSVLFEDYERQHHAIDTSDLTPVDMLKHLMEQHDMSASDLGRLLGERSLGSKILTGSRELSKSHIRKLCDHFGVSADLFL